MKRINIILGFIIGLAFAAHAQEKIGDKLYDNGLALAVTSDDISQKGEFQYCVLDTATGYCVQNLTTGVKVKVFAMNDNLLWEGIASGRTPKLKLPRKLPKAHYLTITAFKPYVINKSTGTHIHQDEKLHLKYYIK